MINLVLHHNFGFLCPLFSQRSHGHILFFKCCFRFQLNHDRTNSHDHIVVVQAVSSSCFVFCCGTFWDSKKIKKGKGKKVQKKEGKSCTKKKVKEEKKESKKRKKERKKVKKSEVLASFESLVALVLA